MTLMVSYAAFISLLQHLFTVMSVRYPTIQPNAAPTIPNNTAVAMSPIATISGIIPIATSVAPTALNNNAKPIVHPLAEIPEACFCGELRFGLPTIGSWLSCFSGCRLLLIPLLTGDCCNGDALLVVGCGPLSVGCACCGGVETNGCVVTLLAVGCSEILFITSVLICSRHELLSLLPPVIFSS